MVDPRDAERAALLNELEMRQARKKAVPPVYHKLSIVEKHLYRERKFQEQREKRRAAAEREALRKVRGVLTESDRGEAHVLLVAFWVF